MTTKALKRFFRFQADDNGASAAEFALVVMPMVVLTFAIIEFGSLMFIWNEMKGAAREATRCVSVADTTFDGGTLQCGAQSAGSAEDVACTFLSSWWPTFTISMSQQTVTGGSNIHATITTPMSEAVLVDLFGVMDGRTLEAGARMRQEVPSVSVPGPGC